MSSNEWKTKFKNMKPIKDLLPPIPNKQSFVYGSNSDEADYIQYVNALSDWLNNSKMNEDDIKNYINEVMDVFIKNYSVEVVNDVAKIFINKLNVYKQSKATPTNSFYATNWQPLKNNPYAGGKYKKTKKNRKNKKSRHSNRNGQRKNAMGSSN